MATYDATRKGMDSQNTPPRTAAEKREAVRAAYERRTTIARQQMNVAIQQAETVREQAILQVNTVFQHAVQAAETAFADEMEGAVRERTALMNKLLLEA